MRDKTLDGFRAVAVSCVVFAHATAYRFADTPGMHYPQRLADPLAELGVQIFFVISGYIITTLLLREEVKDGSASVPAFYARRVFRILPPFAVFLIFAPAYWLEKVQAAAFTCNLVQCDWAVAHSWSLAVEEQFYLLWPLLFVTLGKHRTPFLIATVVALTAVFFLRPPTFHSNAASFSHIAVGALLAIEPSWRVKGRYWAWLAVAGALVLGPISPLAKMVAVVNPLLIAYMIFGAYDLPLIRKALGSAPLQWIGSVSYSMYLWQQPFLSKGSSWPLWSLPIAVVASRYLIELPFNRAGHGLSTRLKRHAAASTAESMQTP